MAKYDAEKFDSTLNTFREIYSNPAVDKYQGTVILPLDFSLEMDGVSGIIPNSAFEIPTDSLPKGYITKKGKSKPRQFECLSVSGRTKVSRTGVVSNSSAY